MNVSEIKEKIIQYHKDGKKIFCTSSFQTQSLVLLKILSEIEFDITIYFLNTGYIFPETLLYKQELTSILNLKVTDLTSGIPKSEQKDDLGRLLYYSDTDRCCYFNKVLPLEPILKIHDVWISGVRKIQTDVRSKMKHEEEGPFNTIRFHPLLDWTDSMVESFINKYSLPRHPLEKFGYKSIGCEPCTRRISMEEGDDSRNARWFGSTKTECGLHTELRGVVK